MTANDLHFGRDLDGALDARWSKNDAISGVVAFSMHLISVFRAVGRERLVYVYMIAIELGLLLLPPRHRRRLRTPIVSLLRVGGLLLIPLKVNALRIVQPDPAAVRRPPIGISSVASVAWVLGTMRSVSSHVRGAVMLMFPVAWLHGFFGVPIGLQLPPVPHAMLHIASILILQRRTPLVCQQYLDRHPSNPRVVVAAYLALERVTGLIALGAHKHLEAISRRKSMCQKCAVVVWVLQVSLGLVLPTLMVWRSQLDAAVAHTRRQRQQWQQLVQERAADGRHHPTRSSSSGEHHSRHLEVQEAAAAALQAEAELQRSQYWQVCRPILLSLEWYGWLVAVLLSAVLSFVGAVLWQEWFGAAPAA